MPRISAVVDEDLADWVAAEADRRDCSKAELIRDELRRARQKSGDGTAGSGSGSAGGSESGSPSGPPPGAGDPQVDHDFANGVDRDPVGVEDDRIVQMGTAVRALCEAEGIDLARRRMEATLAEMHVPAQDSDYREAHREAIALAWDHLRVVGEATSEQLWNHLWEARSEDLYYSSVEGMWSMVRPRLVELPGIEHGGGRKYRFEDPIEL